MAGSLDNASVECHKSEMYVSGNPSVSERLSLMAEESLQRIDSVAIEESLREARQSRVSVLGTGLSFSQEWSSLRGDEDSERHDSQFESLQAVTEKREQSVKEVPVVDRDRENLKESNWTMDLRPVSQVAGSLNNAIAVDKNSEPYLSENPSVSQQTS